MRRSHRHASLMMQYALDATKHHLPWEFWQFKNPLSDGNWHDLNGDCNWIEDYEYRRRQVINDSPIIGVCLKCRVSFNSKDLNESSVCWYCQRKEDNKLKDIEQKEVETLRYLLNHAMLWVYTCSVDNQKRKEMIDCFELHFKNKQ